MNRPIIDRNTIHESPHGKKLIAETFINQRGKLAEWIYMETRPSVIMAAVTTKNTVLFVDQERYTLGETVRELPAGIVDKGETPKEAAERELLEETGFTSEEWQELGEFYFMPGETDRKTTIFLAREAIRIANPMQEMHHDISCRELPIKILDASPENLKRENIYGGETVLAMKLAAAAIRRT